MALKHQQRATEPQVRLIAKGDLGPKLDLNFKGLLCTKIIYKLEWSHMGGVPDATSAFPAARPKSALFIAGQWPQQLFTNYYRGAESQSERVRVARSRGKEPEVGVDQAASTPTAESFV